MPTYTDTGRRKYNKSQFRTVDGQIEKTCTQCENWLPYTEEYYAYSKDGLRSHCKRCSQKMTARAHRKKREKERDL